MKKTLGLMGLLSVLFFGCNASDRSVDSLGHADGQEDAGLRPVTIVVTQREDDDMEADNADDDTESDDDTEPAPETDAGADEPDDDTAADDDTGADAGPEENCVLTVVRTDTPTSRTVVKGAEGEPVLGLSLQASGCDVTWTELPLIALGDSDGNFQENDGSNPTRGDLAGYEIAFRATLSRGQDVLAGPATIQSNGETVFDDLEYTILDGEVWNVVVEADFLNGFDGERYFALSVDPSMVQGEDADGNPVEVQGAVINGGESPNPVIRVVDSGDLTVYAEGNPDATIVVAGEEQLASRYRFHALREAWGVHRFTVCNDGVGAFDAPVSTVAVDFVRAKYTDENGMMEQSAYGVLAGGCVTFSALNFYVPAEGDAYLEFYATANTKAVVGELLSGMEFRIGLKDTANTGDTFEAVGRSSARAITSPVVSNNASVNTFVVRTTRPYLEYTAMSSVLINGERDFYGVSITADSAGAVGLGRLVYRMSVAGLNDEEDDIINFHFDHGPNRFSPADVSIYCTDASGANVTEIRSGVSGLDACDGLAGDGIADGTYYIIVSFDEEEVIDGGSTATYYVGGWIMGASTGSVVVTSLDDSDETIPLMGLTANTNANTGKLFVQDDMTAGIFWQSATDFSRLLMVGASVLWTDRSADGHAPAVIAAGVVTSDTGSYDWTNGYLLGVSELSAHVLTY